MSLKDDVSRYDSQPLTPYELFQFEHRLSDAEMQYIKMFYVKGKTRYRLPNNEIIEIKIPDVK